MQETNLQINNSLFKGTAIENFRILPAEMFLTEFVPRIIGLIFVIGSLAFFFMMLMGAISWIISGGDKAHVESAKAKITNALIGFILMISTFAIIKIIELFFDINILLIDIGPLVIQ